MNHVVLVGDSVFDNASYVEGGPAVIDHLGTGGPSGWGCTLLAVDGALARDVSAQLDQLPAAATHIAVSAGGNNALQHRDMVLSKTSTPFVEVLTRLAKFREEFQAEYRAMLEKVQAARKPTLVCTIYDSIPGLAPAEKAALCLFNDVILQEAVRAGVPVLDLRLVCTDEADYSEISEIEPSVIGGAKIARSIARVIKQHDFTGGTQIYD